MTAGRQARGYASSVLHRIAAEISSRDRVSFGELLHHLGPSGFGLALIALALPAMIPIPGPFGMVTGSCLVLIAFQMLLGWQRLALPRFLAERHLAAGGVTAVIMRALPWIRRFEAMVRHGRWRSLTGPSSHVLVGIPVLLLAVVLALPIPFGNVGPVVSLLVIGLSLVARDGLALMVGLVLALATFAWTGVLIFAGAHVAAYLGNLFI
ncbi:exopolysaccharide biosynthesis protein [Pleomorphomonas sp. NRK KF1]|uniref:exopolysaccharide biosynthesis protein n=1 Tax=Pleomorphomonas sp. NRK KF1 TaxID=2943000 RepID=UPI00204394FB|nr:exopolysaccharide biosynthesis protein [Pleomorphomonas sp. NRK KF1]MCM5551659.1 exopolysaccharide biosynthesis protein [Pleomorphomonas sp. NRK KF1]